MIKAQHDLDTYTNWCLRCGQGRRDILEHRAFECQATSNVVAISHMVRGRFLRLIAEEIDGR